VARNQHVVHNPNGGWDVRPEGAQRASRHFDRQSDAILAARETARKQQVELLIHGRNGQIRQRDSYGNDPCPPKDKQ